ncbi:MAG: metallophosphoesterase, partial [Candidatus Delongbacteria bacterium]|nr:metallophosphoesterase [Candidatus Delongbacteria bacterium]
KIRIIQLSDIHISPKDIVKNGANIRGNFLRAVEAVKKIEHDLIVISGDLALDIDNSDYEWIKSKLHGLNYFVIPGNHDVSENLSNHFGLNKCMTDGKIFYKERIKGRDFIFADTSQEWLDLNILEKFIDRNSEKGNSFVFMHHPPSKCNSKHMDTYYLLGNHIEATEFFNNCEQISHVFCGHYHTAHNLKNENFTIYIAPSTWYQIGRKLKKFNIKHSRPGWTLIEISDEVRVENYFLNLKSNN